MKMSLVEALKDRDPELARFYELDGIFSEIVREMITATEPEIGPLLEKGRGVLAEQARREIGDDELKCYVEFWTPAVCDDAGFSGHTPRSQRYSTGEL